MIHIEEMCQKAKKAARNLSNLTSIQKNHALGAVAEWLMKDESRIIKANNKDVEKARDLRLTPAMVDRLALTPDRIRAMAQGLEQIIELEDPIGEIIEERRLPSGLKIKKQRVPLGVIAVIYESRPNVTVDVSALALKSGNAVILRGGSETIQTNLVLTAGIRNALSAAGVDDESVQFIDEPDRKLVEQLLRMHEYINMLIPRGGAALHRYCRENSMIPVITGGIGICHIFVDESADLEKSIEVIRNAKIQRPTVCNALDTVLVHQNIAAAFIPMLIAKLKKDGVTFRVEEKAMKGLALKEGKIIQTAGPDDFDQEWLSLILGIKVVQNIDEAVEHIILHSTEHSDGILTENDSSAAEFISKIDSAAVYVNASTRFTDGGEFGLGAEVAVSTQRLHARGPMALNELTSYKWIGEGDYLVRN